MQLARVVIVIGLVVGAAVLATPKGQTPIALRAIRKLFRKSQGVMDAPIQPVPTSRRLIAFLLVLIAFALAVI